MQIFKKTPSFILTLATIALVVLFISLGNWQIHRGQYKNNLERQFNIQQKQGSLNLSQFATTDPSQSEYAPIEVKGFYDNAHTFLLDNQIYNHRVGYMVLTPLISQLPTQFPIVLVNRGWIPRLVDRNHLPDLKSVFGLQTLHGMLKRPSRSFLLSKSEEQIKWPLLIQSIDLERISRLLKQPLYPFIVLLDPKDPNGFERKWNVVIMPASKHYGYAAQWFALALTLVIIYIFLNVKWKSNNGSEKSN